MKEILPIERITSRIYSIRGIKVMLDRDLAELYGVETKVLKQAVKRNIDRFPSDFMFELTRDEFNSLRSQIVTSSWGGPRYLPDENRQILRDYEPASALEGRIWA